VHGIVYRVKGNIAKGFRLDEKGSPILYILKTLKWW
jgi:hypothetical protein